ncbi:hypothetical protein ATE92_0573 [Ulvibacter sp. MAR_2010_11]|uniref:hypothetical protein n=1 Tax=Ulvibacter sp. MAR_2010_11 TaxID=1250229 RepID=UPI000C2BE522|nr:hypothetical protein [Ulvibacter sp. MAR_2010_11]PKA82444.1 hypothetical protein ATE92_0573 [Ulvibacter sp. MAR_2010_11]
MKKITVLLLLALLLVPKAQAQDKGAGIVAAVAGLAAIGGAIVAVEQMKEQAELKATEWVLNYQPEMTSFSLKTLDFDGKKGKDMSATSLITYKIQEFQLAEKPELDGKKFVLFGFTSYGWVNEYGVDFSKVRWMIIDAEEWLNMMAVYVKTASSERDEASIKERLRNGKIVNRGVKERFDTTINFYKMEGDMYTVRNYNDAMKFVYNERTLGIYLKETQNLVQIGRDDIIKIHDFFYGED